LVRVPEVEDPVQVPSLVVKDMEPLNNQWNVGYKVNQCPFMPVVAARDPVKKEIYFIAFEDELSFDIWKSEHTDLEILRIW
jgi:hypothetical protein